MGREAFENFFSKVSCGYATITRALQVLNNYCIHSIDNSILIGNYTFFREKLVKNFFNLKIYIIEIKYKSLTKNPIISEPILLENKSKTSTHWPATPTTAQAGVRQPIRIEVNLISIKLPRLDFKKCFTSSECLIFSETGY